MDVVAVQDVAATLRSGSTSPSAHGKLNGTDRMDLVVHTLAIRGRGDHRELETRDDGTATALLLPNGGRDGIGCGAVAVGIPALAACVTSREGNRFDSESTTMLPVTAGTLDKGIPGPAAGNFAGYLDHLLPSPMQVRRLTPTECARLQGFPDHHARIPWRGKPADECPDGPQYKAYGNSMAVPVMRWIGHRLDQYLKAQQ
jgi:DNA (cytosine-5)-methyltransferase 1